MSRFPLAALLLLIVVGSSGCLFLRAPELRDENLLLQQRMQAVRQDKAVVDEQLATSRRTTDELTRALAQARDEAATARRELEAARQETSTARLRLQQSTDSIGRETSDRLAAMETAEREARADLEQALDRAASLEIRVMSLEEELATIQESLTTARGRILEDGVTIDSLRTRQGNLQSQVTTLETTLAEREATVTSLTSRLEQTESDLRLVRGQLEERETALAAERTKLAEATQQREEALSEAEALRAAGETGKAVSDAVNAHLETARARLQRQIASGNVRIEGAPNGLRLIFFSDELFNTGTTVLSDTGKTLLAAAEDIANQVPYGRILVEGHTDNQPIRTLPYPDNWELGAARASEVVRWLASRPGIEAGKIVAQSRSSHAPMATNNTAEGRRQNRRVEIHLELEAGQ